MELSAAFHRALSEAARYHDGHYIKGREKGAEVPYLSHLLGVCSLVMQAGGTETEAIAALLHDAAEDAGGEPTLAEIEENFGSDVAAIVRGCSDSLEAKGAPKQPWRERKKRYLEHLKTADVSTLLVSAADKLYNIRAIEGDFDRIGARIFEIFNVPDPKADWVIWYYRSLHGVYEHPRTAADPRRSRLTRPMKPVIDRLDAEATPGAIDPIRA